MLLKTTKRIDNKQIEHYNISIYIFALSTIYL